MDRMTDSNNNVLVVTEGGKEFGFGHITRCLSIANAFQQRGLDVNFVVNGDDSIISLFDKTPMIFNWLKNRSKLLEFLEDSQIVLIDSMMITDAQILDIESICNITIFIDDEKRRNVLNSGFVIDWTVLSDEKNYFNFKKNVTYLLGSKYTPLRSEFRNAEKNPIRESIEKIMISFGGADIRNLSPVILGKLDEFLPGCEKYVIIGSGYKNVKDIERCKDSNIKLIFNANASKMVNIMQSVDLAIAGGGQTLYELAKVGTPTIAILLVENAKDDTEGWCKVGSVDNIGWWNDKNLLLNLKKSIEILQSKRIRKRMQDNATPYITANGASNIVERILDSL